MTVGTKNIAFGNFSDDLVFGYFSRNSILNAEFFICRIAMMKHQAARMIHAALSTLCFVRINKVANLVSGSLLSNARLFFAFFCIHCVTITCHALRDPKLTS